MSQMIMCDNCKKLMHTDSRGDKGEYIIVKIEDPVYGFSFHHLCRRCYYEKFPWMREEDCNEEMREDAK